MEERLARSKPKHLMCGTRPWGALGFVVSAYFAYTSYADLHGDFYWQSGWWTVLTWAVWLVLTAGLLSETRCWRERLLFGLLLGVFIIGLISSAWSSAPPATTRHAREAALALWGLAALASLLTLSRPADIGS